MLTSSLLAILLVPAWLPVLGPLLDYPVSLRPERVALVLAKSFLLPLALGMLVRRLFPAIAERVGNRLIAIAGLVLTGCALALLILHWDILILARWSGVLILAGLIATSLAIGHLLGGPPRMTVPRSRLPARRAISGSPCWWQPRFPARARRSSLRSTP